LSRVAYVNGRYLPHGRACVHVEDRGYQFADGVYEVCEVARGCIIDMTRHLDRLGRSLRELEMNWPMDRAALQLVLAEVVRRNRVRDGLVYLQVTRGVARRDHVYPAAGTKPAIVVTARSADPAVARAKAEHGVSVITVPDNRWERVDVKSIGLLPNAMAREKARESGAAEAWFVDGSGHVTEGAATNAWIVTKNGVLVTRPAENGILRGITRAGVIDLAASRNLKVEERSFTVEEAKEAREAFITAATTLVMPVVAIDGDSVANGHPGSTAMALRDAFFDAAEKTPVYC
jgi:D-alanine transaminase